MVWLFVALAVLIVGVIIYFLIPIFKRKSIKENSSTSSKRPDRALIRQARRDKRQARREAKEGKKQNKKSLINKVDSQGKETIIVGENSEIVNEPYEDPDTKVNYDNFDLDGLFSEHPTQSDDNFNFSDDSGVETSNENYDELFEKFFSNQRPSEANNLHHASLKNPFDDKTPYSMESDGSIDPEEINMQQFLDEYDLDQDDVGDGRVRRAIDNMSPEMKAIMLSNILDKKDY